MRIEYSDPQLSEEMKDTLTTYLRATFPGCSIQLDKGEGKLLVTDVDDLRYVKRAKDAVVALIRLAKYVSEEY